MWQRRVYYNYIRGHGMLKMAVEGPQRAATKPPQGASVGVLRPPLARVTERRRRPRAAHGAVFASLLLSASTPRKPAPPASTIPDLGALPDGARQPKEQGAQW